jgi:hypothetical protein
MGLGLIRLKYTQVRYLCPSLIPFEVEMAIKKKVKRYKSPGVDNIPAGFIQAGGRKIHSKIHKLIKSLWNKEE